MASIVVVVSCGSAKEAHRIARALVRKKLAACVNMIGPMKSVYRWKAKLQTGKEVLMLIKTTQKRFVLLEREIRRLHGYSTPEIIALPVVAGSKPYLDWLRECMED